MEKGNRQKPKKDIKQAYRTAYLVAGYIRQTLTEEEHEELDDWVVASEENMQLFGELTDEKNLEKSLEWYQKMDVERELSKSKKELQFNRSGKTKRLWQFAIAASIILAIGLLIFLIPFSKKPTTPEIVINMPSDILPGSDKATLTLDNGTVIFLAPDKRDTTINSTITISQQKGEIVYADQSSPSAMVYHLLSIPRKGQYKLTLPDGTKVWLNAESSIRYPIAFSNKERKVFVTGETYFEVAKDKTKPFRVVTNDLTVEALGTQFNINAYPDEPFVSTTLVEGSVLLSKGSSDNILKPGQQAQIVGDHFNIINTEVADVIAWKNDQFKFTKAPIDEIMRQIARWYDAEIVYQDKPSYHFNATIERSVPVSKLLHWLEETNHVHFKVEDKKIIIMK